MGKLRDRSPLAFTHPHLVAELVNPEIALRVTQGMGHSVPWMCARGHSWRARISSRAGGARCPFCSGRRPWPGESDLATTHPGLAQELLDQRDAIRVSSGSERPAHWRCARGHVWVAVIRVRVRGRPCPECANTDVQ